jgi:hypothetical protein
MDNDLVSKYLGVNFYEGICYYSKENFEELIDWIFTFAGLKLMNCESSPEKTLEECLAEKTKVFRSYREKLRDLTSISNRSEYKLDELKKMIIQRRL